MQDHNKIGAVNPGDLVQARLFAHQAAQWLARFGYAYIDPASDDSHAALAWDSGRRALVTRKASAKSGNVRLGLNFDNFSLSLRQDNEKDPDPLLLDGLNDGDIGQYLHGQLSLLELDSEKLFRKLPYELPANVTGRQTAYQIGKSAGELTELGRYFDYFAGLLEDIRQNQEGVSPVRCWPHHFDIAILIELEPGGGEDARSIGAGLSPGDDNYQEPYLYVSPWPYPEQDILPTLPEPGIWHREGFTSAIGTASALTATGDFVRHTERLMKSAIEACKKLLVKDF